MPGLLEALLGQDTDTVERVRTHTGNDPKRAEQAYSAAVGTILRGLEAKSQTEEGAESIWEMLRKQVEQGNVPADAPAQGGRVQVRDLDPKVANDMLKVIFGKNAPEVEGGFGKSSALPPFAIAAENGSLDPRAVAVVFRVEQLVELVVVAGLGRGHLIDVLRRDIGSSGSDRGDCQSWSAAHCAVAPVS